MLAKQPEHWLYTIFTINIVINLEKLLGESKLGFVGRRRKGLLLISALLTEVLCWVTEYSFANLCFLCITSLRFP